MKAYLAGPMRGLPLYNFPAFDDAAKALRDLGWEIISPAEMDRNRGFKETDSHVEPQFLKQAIFDDLNAISNCDAVIILPGWETSKGVAVEIALARFLEIPVLSFTTALRGI
jgi:nucleoside 2-deoxyribosyltransferase